MQLLRLVAEFARQHGAGHPRPGPRPGCPGRERAVRPGGEATPLVAEFAPAVLAARLGPVRATPAAGRSPTSSTCEYRLPSCWARVRASQVAARATPGTWPARPATSPPKRPPTSTPGSRSSADGRVSWTRFETLVEAAIIAADPDAASRHDTEPWRPRAP